MESHSKLIPYMYRGCITSGPRLFLYVIFMFFFHSRRGVVDKCYACKPGVAGSIPGFSIKPLSVSLVVFPY